MQKTSQLSLLIAIYNGMAIYVFGAKSSLFSENEEKGEPFGGLSSFVGAARLDSIPPGKPLTPSCHLWGFSGNKKSRLLGTLVGAKGLEPLTPSV